MLLLAARVRGLPGRRELLVAGITAALMISYALAQTYTATANAILLQYAAPIYVLALSPFLLGERPRAADLLAAPPLVAGIVLIFFSGSGDHGSLFGNALGALSGVLYAFLIICLRRWPGSRGLAGIGWGNVIAAAIAIPAAALVGKEAGGLVPPTAKSAAEIVFLGIFQIGVAYVLFERALRSLRAIEVGLIAMVEPVACPFWAFLFLGERPAGLALAGGALIVVTLATHTVAASRGGKAAGRAGGEREGG